MSYVAVVCFNFAALAGITYMVGWHGWSPWWFLLYFGVAHSVTDRNGNENKTNTSTKT